MQGLATTEASGFDITMLDGDLGAVIDPSRTAVLSACPPCWPGCFVCCADAPADE
ncbi:MAG TPA: hypothetical protein VHV49_02605 [Pseudonocardiaceae bacterium]|nr:hypothetical protein [Pseudonocardiaceae bacterium]